MSIQKFQTNHGLQSVVKRKKLFDLFGSPFPHNLSELVLNEGADMNYFLPKEIMGLEPVVPAVKDFIKEMYQL